MANDESPKGPKPPYPETSTGQHPGGEARPVDQTASTRADQESSERTVEAQGARREVRPRREPPRHKLAGWLEQPGERTQIEALADRYDHEGDPRPEAWDRVAMISEGPLRPPGYDVGISTLRMTVFLLLFSWAPIFNGALAGLLGGWRAGTQRRALTAAVLSVALVCGAFWLAFVATDRTLMFFYGLPLWAWMLTTLLSTLLGAWAGASSRWAVREEHGQLRRWAEGPWAEPRRRDWIEG